MPRPHLRSARHSPRRASRTVHPRVLGRVCELVVPTRTPGPTRHRPAIHRRQRGFSKPSCGPAPQRAPDHHVRFGGGGAAQVVPYLLCPGGRLTHRGSPPASPPAKRPDTDGGLLSVILGFDQAACSRRRQAPGADASRPSGRARSSSVWSGHPGTGRGQTSTGEHGPACSLGHRVAAVALLVVVATVSTRGVTGCSGPGWYGSEGLSQYALPPK
jgi:hypothetical protein